MVPRRDKPQHGLEVLASCHVPTKTRTRPPKTPIPANTIAEVDSITAFESPDTLILLEYFKKHEWTQEERLQHLEKAAKATNPGGPTQEKDARENRHQLKLRGYTNRIPLTPSVTGRSIHWHTRPD